MTKLIWVLGLMLAVGCGGKLQTSNGDDAGVDLSTSDAGDSSDLREPDAGQTPDADMGPVDLGQDFSPDLPPDLGPDLGPEGTAGCIDGAGLAEGENTFMLDGRERRFIVRLPSGYTKDKAWPLVFALHGNGGSASYWDGTSGTRNIRDVLKDDAILIVAEAIEGNWRDYNQDSSTWPARIELELNYFDALITQASDEMCVDPNEIFAMGFSGGGSFSGVLGCRRTDIRAIAVGGSVIYFDPDNCVEPAPAAWITIGTQELAAGRVAYRDYFRDWAQCAETSVDTSPSPCIAYDGCSEGLPVHYCQHPAGHIWPDFGSQAMWDFFSRFVTN